MFRFRLKGFAAKVALLALLSMHLHVLEHVFGFDHDEGNKPCPICQEVLSLQTVGPVADIVPPEAPVAFVEVPVLLPQEAEFLLVSNSDSRGPPAILQA